MDISEGVFMQSYDGENIIAAHEVTNKDIVAKIMKQNERGATHHIIGTIPERGTIISINGLKYRVLSFSKKGDLRLEMINEE